MWNCCAEDNIRKGIRREGWRGRKRFASRSIKESFLEQFRLLLLKCNDSDHQGNTDVFLQENMGNIFFQNCKYRIQILGLWLFSNK